MTRRWTEEEDHFLLTWADAAGADFVAQHDLGRPWGAGSRRLNALNENGASRHFAAMMIERLHFELAAGRGKRHEYQHELHRWEAKHAEALSLVRLDLENAGMEGSA